MVRAVSVAALAALVLGQNAAAHAPTTAGRAVEAFAEVSVSYEHGSVVSDVEAGNFPHVVGSTACSGRSGFGAERSTSAIRPRRKSSTRKECRKSTRSPTEDLGSDDAVSSTDRAAFSGRFAPARRSAEIEGLELGFAFEAEGTSDLGYTELVVERNGVFLD